jgi:hypothetical protein
VPNGPQRPLDLLSSPMQAVITALGVGIAQAQRELDRYAIETQREINEDPLLSEYGLRATWYQMPRTDLELTTAIAMEEQTDIEGPEVLRPYGLRQIHLQPINAFYANQFDYDVQASSKIKLAIVPVPPPAAEEAVVPRRDRADVIDIARPHLVTEDDGTTLRADSRLAVNFNGQARVWFVVQYILEDDQFRRLALVTVDDDTGQVVRHEAES